jgi:DNA-binding response OmpR family regulator
MDSVLLIDDNALDRKIAVDVLEHAGFQVSQASNGRDGLKLLYECRPGVIVLDVMMPDMTGWQVCERIRELCDTPILMLTSLDRDEDMVRGLELGGDDFVSKPVSPNVLLARIRAILRRSRGAHVESAGFAYDDGVLCIDAEGHEVRLDGQVIDLTPTEFRLLLTLARSPSRVHPYAELLSEIWGAEYVDDIDFLRVYVWRLRKKLESGADGQGWISNERGFGYRFKGAVSGKRAGS